MFSRALWICMQTGGSFDNLGAETWQQSSAIKRLFSAGGDSDMPVCIGFRMVMGASRMDSAQWNIPIRNTISWARHHRCCEPLLHICHSAELPFSPLRTEIRDLPLLCYMDCHHDNICLLLPAWNQGGSHWRDDIPMEKALVLEEDHAGYPIQAIRFSGSSYMRM